MHKLHHWIHPTVENKGAEEEEEAEMATHRETTARRDTRGRRSALEVWGGYNAEVENEATKQNKWRWQRRRKGAGRRQ